MEGTRVGKMSCQFVAVVFAVVASLMMLSGPASAGGQPVPMKAARAAVEQATKDTVKDGFNSWATDGCKRNSAGRLKCRIVAEDDEGMQTKRCLLTYGVKKSGGSLKATLIKKNRCVRNPYPLLTREQALDRVLSVGTRRSGTTVTVKELVRLGRSSYRGVVQWVRETGFGNASCDLEVTVSVKKKINAFAWDPECRPAEKPDYDELVQHGPGPKYCPGNAGKTWNAKDDLIGKTLTEAAAIAKEHGCSVRPVIIDGSGQVITDDLRFNRINVEIEGTEQRVVSIHRVY
jgi:hypothetical protein